MMPMRHTRGRSLLACLLAFAAGCAVAQQTPDEFLQSVSDALNTASYRGTLIQSADGRIATMHVMHSNIDGVVREKLVAMDGEGSEILRTGDELICLLPEQKLKLIESNNVPSSAFARLPAGVSQLNEFYTLEDRGADRIAGRPALQYFLRPRDQFRYGHRLWVDRDSLLPLRMQLVSRSRIIEEVRFTDVEVGIEIPEDDFMSSIDSTDFKVIRASAAPVPTPTVGAKSAAKVSDNESRGWPVEPYPGFKLRATQTRTVSINGQVTQRLVFSDGLATISVFIGARPAQGGDDADAAKVARLGAAHSLQRRIGNNSVTLVGEVPAETLRMLAAGAERQMSPQDSDASTR